MRSAESRTGSRILRRAITRHGRRLGTGTALISLHQGCEALVPILIGLGIDRAVAPRDGGALLVWVAALAVLFTALTMFYRFGARQLMLAIAQEAHLLRDELAAKIMHPRGIRTELRAGELLTVASTDADNVSYLLDYVPRIAGAIVATIISAVALLVIDVPLGLAVLIGTPVVLIALQVSAPLITRRVADQQELAGKATSLATDLVSGLRPLRGVGAERAAARRYHDVSQASLRASLRAASTQGKYLAASTTCSALLACGIAVMAGWFALNGRISIGEFITVIGLAQFLIEPATLLAIVPSWVAEARASAERAGLVLDADHVLGDRGLPEEGDGSPGTGGLTLAGLSYGPLNGVDLTVRPGEFVGVVAHRAAEAEALIKVLSGRVAPDEYEGQVLLGGAPISGLDLAQARASLLVEPHHTDLFTGTIASNISAGDDRPPTDVLTDALAASAADQVVGDHPDGLEHLVAERGVSLSGGQRQRLALARALIAGPPILVLHDPTTAVDAVTERSIAQGIRALRHPDGGARFATVVVTSSPPLLAAADRIVVLDDGRVTVEGVHAELGATDEDYRKAVLR
jgi:putative ABC transport system ATP-binding protein